MYVVYAMFCTETSFYIHVGNVNRKSPPLAARIYVYLRIIDKIHVLEDTDGGYRTEIETE